MEKLHILVRDSLVWLNRDEKAYLESVPRGKHRIETLVVKLEEDHYFIKEMSESGLILKYRTHNSQFPWYNQGLETEGILSILVITKTEYFAI